MAALIALGILDAVTGFILMLGPWIPLGGNGILFTLGVIILLKGIITWLMAAASRFFFDPLGILDIIAGACCLIEVSGFHLSVFAWIGFFLLVKGAYCVFIDLIR
jgi:hypothetical protein